MKKNKSKLDEMQEKKLLKIEHNTLTLTSVGLLASIFIQQAILTEDSHVVIGESIVLLVFSLYMLIACIRNGIWDRSAKQPNMKEEHTDQLDRQLSSCFLLVCGFIYSVSCVARLSDHIWGNILDNIYIIDGCIYYVHYSL